MNKRVIGLVVALAVLIGGAVAAYGLSRASETPTAQHTSSPAASGATSAGAGAYVDYSTTAIADGTGATLLFFHAPWCAQCRAIEADILKSGVPADTTIIKVDFDSNQALRQKYGVTLQTTFVEVDSAGRGIESFVAYDDPRLQAVIDALL